MTEVLSEVNKIFIDVLDNEKIVLTKETVADDIKEWDSLNHIQLIIAIEKHYKIRFSSVEIQRWRNVGEMCDGVIQKLNQQ